MSRGPDSEPDPEVPGWIVAIGRVFGLTPIQTRWKVANTLRRLRRFRRETTVRSVADDLQKCPTCNALQPLDGKVCTSCGDPLDTATVAGRIMRTLGLTLPSFVSVSAVLGLAMVFVYFRMMTAYPGDGLFAWSHDALIAHGALWPPSVDEGQWWRLGTACFVHIGIWHIFFNLTGLLQVGPLVEDVYGRGKMAFIFILTGLLSFGCSAVVMPFTPTAGASGALMGLIGTAASWGHSDKTTRGREIRNVMLKWAVYTMIFGFAIGANNVAHAAGFASGWILGQAIRPLPLDERRGRVTFASIAFGTIGGLAAVFFTILALKPLASSYALAATFAKKTSHVAFDDDMVAPTSDGFVTCPARPTPASAEQTTAALRRFRAEQTGSFVVSSGAKAHRQGTDIVVDHGGWSSTLSAAQWASELWINEDRPLVVPQAEGPTPTHLDYINTILPPDGVVASFNGGAQKEVQLLVYVVEGPAVEVHNMLFGWAHAAVSTAGCLRPSGPDYLTRYRVLGATDEKRFDLAVHFFEPGYVTRTQVRVRVLEHGPEHSLVTVCIHDEPEEPRCDAAVTTRKLE
jgi:rhomboid protease GluP